MRTFYLKKSLIFRKILIILLILVTGKFIYNEIKDITALKRHQSIRDYINSVYMNSSGRFQKSFQNSHNDQEFRLSPDKMELCSTSSEGDSLIVAFVIIAPHLFEKRAQIRSTWADKTHLDSSKLKLKCIFSLGLSQLPHINEKIKQESNMWHDILQLNHFFDSYFNMTHKIMSSFQWVSKLRCSRIKFIMRINDDVVVNTFALTNFLTKQQENNVQSFQMYGLKVSEAKVVRNKNSKFFISQKEYKLDVYPDYMSGSVYIMTIDLAEQMSKLYGLFHFPPFSIW